MQEIDWEEQWKLHAPSFKEGRAHVDLGKFGGPDVTFSMVPGPGFGDLSHPTTRLMLMMMPKEITSQVIDLGCGSGVLSLAAASRGASQVHGIDNCEESLTHARKNGPELSFGRGLPEWELEKPLVLLNMISSEQVVAWECHQELHENRGEVIVSGVPVEERDRYLKKAPFGALVCELNLEGWCGFAFKPDIS